MPARTIPGTALRAVLGRYATGVVVVTAAGPVGLTVNSFTSVSLDPPLVLFCLREESRLRGAFGSAFAVNVLREGQREVARRFAGRDGFDGLPHRTGRSGAPLLAGTLATIECTTERTVAGGDHDIVVGRVLATAVHEAGAADPLLYYEGAYRSLDATHLDCWAAFF
jgi:flavin reductase (DIM6/NTAB) family NADH-FMN oxidoreductase RutF